MAGTAKPTKVKKEMTQYTLGVYKNNNHGTYGTIVPENLFNQNVNESWDHAFDWNTSGDYMTLTVEYKCNIWRYAHPNYTDQSSNLDIQPQTFKKQHTLPHTVGWQLWIEGLEPGTYTFTGKGGLRLDTEWYLEMTETPSSIIKEKVLNTINNNEYFKKCLKCEIEIEEE